MCAWKRGTQNNLPGSIRMGHIKEYLTLQSRDASNSVSLRVIDYNDKNIISDTIYESYANQPIALVSSSLKSSLVKSKAALSTDIPSGLIYLHSHKFSHSIISCIIHDSVPIGCIILKDFQLVNAKVCVGDIEEFTYYEGEQFAYDTREGAIGDTKLRFKPLYSLQKALFSIQPRDSSDDSIELDTNIAGNLIAKALYGCIVTKEEVYVFHIGDIDYICHVQELVADDGGDGEKNEEDDIDIKECYRGIVDASMEGYLTSTHKNMILLNKKEFISAHDVKNIVYVISNDYEVFPVKRRLLRPCISLTFVAQHGRGKYKDDTLNSSNQNQYFLSSTLNHDKYMSESEKQELHDIIDDEYLHHDLIKINVDACTFDRVLLYLEHEARHEMFQFDPLLVNDLYDAAKILNITGLKECCEKVLGSFQDRVRRTPIRLQEIISRNHAGGYDIYSSDSTCHKKKRRDTLLIMSGMIFDITNWLDEHPGGSAIIPEQALNVDSTIFFEIYHASRQSFLYLKEFYIGELAKDDLDKVPLPSNCPLGTQASDAFMEQLRRLTDSWRLKDHEIQHHVPAYKSF